MIVDSFEVLAGSDPIQYNSPTADADGDELPDWLELALLSDPLSLDSDDDGATDLEEFLWQSDWLYPGESAPRLSEEFTASVGSQTALVDASGGYRIDGVPTTTALVRARFDGVIAGQQFFAVSSFASVSQNQVSTVEVARVSSTPIATPLSIAATAAATVLEPGQQTQLVVSGQMSDGTQADLTPRAEGTTYLSSSPAIASVDQNGLVTAIARGIASITVSNQGTTTTRRIDVTEEVVNTTIVGVAQFDDGSSAEGATITLLTFGGTAITGSDGSFTLPVQLPSAINQSLVITATITQGDQQLIATASGLTPVADGITDAGILVLLRPLCDPQWARGFEPPGMNGVVSAMAVFDDGSGPALYAGGDFTTAGGQTVNFIARWDGLLWWPLGTGMDAAVNALTVFDDGSGPALYAGGDFTTAGGEPASRIARWDGSAWAPLGSGISFNGSVVALTEFSEGSGSALYAGGTFSTVGGQIVRGIARWNGSAWLPLGSGITGGNFPIVWALTVFDDGSGPALYVGGDFTSAGGQTVNRIARWDGSAWSPLGLGVTGVGRRVRDLSVFDDGSGPALYAGGTFSTVGGVAVNGIARWDGSSWSPLGLGVSGEVSALTVFDDGSGPALYAGGNFTSAGGQTVNRIARWDGATWSLLGSGTSNPVQALAVFDDGSGPALYAGGEFTSAGGQTVNRIARWDGAAWSLLGSGINNSVQALTVFDDGSGPALYAGGNFTSAGGQAASRIARWDGSAWSPLGSGMDSRVYALTVFDDGSGPALYAGGQFTTAGGQPANRIARWDGSAWSSLGSGMNGTVYALAVLDDGSGPVLYAGGDFTTADGQTVNRIARWDGSNWSSLGSGMNSTVRAMAVLDDGSGPALYAGGFFITAGGQTVNRIARWNGLAWSSLGSGMNGFVTALTVFDGGSGPALHAGGSFTTADGQAANSITRWDGSAWSPLGFGVNGSVLNLMVYDDGSGPALYAGGGFATADEQTANNIARWDGSAWSPLGSGMNNLVIALAVFDDGSGTALYAGGQFTTAGGTSSAYIAKWSRDCSDRSTTLLAGDGSGRFQPFSALRPGFVHEPTGGRRTIDHRRLAASEADRGIPTARGGTRNKPGVREASPVKPEATGVDPARQRADGSPRRYIAEARAIHLADLDVALVPVTTPDPLTNAAGDRAEVRMDLKFGVPRGYVISGAEARAMGTLGGPASGPQRWLGDEVLVGWADDPGGARCAAVWTAADGLLDLNAVVRSRFEDWPHRITGLRGVLPDGLLLVDLDGTDRPGVLELRVFERLEGDLNADGTIDEADLQVIVRQMQEKDPAGDLNRDGAVNAGDVAVVVQQTGRTARELLPTAVAPDGDTP